MKKLIVICLLAAIGAVGMIGKSNATPYCQTNPQSCTNGDMNPGAAQIPLGSQNHWQGQHNQGHNYPHKHNHNWGGGGPFIGFGIYSQPNYYNDGYYGDDPYAYDNPPPAYYSGNRCNALASRLRSMGFRHVQSTKCGGSTYVYFATKSGRAVQVTMSARSGSIIRVANTY